MEIDAAIMTDAALVVLSGTMVATVSADGTIAVVECRTAGEAIDSFLALI